MSGKRDIEDTDGETPEPQTKRAKTNSSKTRQHQHSGIDPTWGQKYVFSSSENATTIPEGEESEFEDDSDAMAYLMSVRKQASAIPHLLVAPPVQIGPQLPPGFDREDESEEEGELDQNTDTIDAFAEPEPRGFYEDGAYIGISEGWGVDIDQDDEPDEENHEAIQKAVNEAYFASILSQYYRTREILHAEPPGNAASRLSRSQATEAISLSPSTTKLWTRLLQTTDPHPIQVALMSKDTVLRIIRVMIGGKFLQSGHSIPQRTSHWLWALLARLPDVGELNHTEIGWIRDLGRRAVLLGRSLAEMAALRDELADDGFGVNDNVDASSSDEEVVAEAIEEGDEDYDAAPAGEATSNGPPGTEDGIVEPVDIPEGENKIPMQKDDESADDGEIAQANESSEDEDVEMDIASDSSGDEGEIIEQADDVAALEEAKRKLLARLAESEHERREEEKRRDARMNMRATLTMILTVAGEFYGQRDLLEFREPFVGM
ncbi:uncharacterized protein TRIVIDRAFT_157887 [Trichoderma virens Gv29-8]|uniref:Uncharacterized protein n=1 Tax=Hypocrea virens (strain Gv29-8 / FGSC 10586) TaxID=413071 RepID=G9N2S2_HYPVG|nr:uncharacterized protein TRIVIDRAFT_157887 [Trichoderma virens Gv29-8]EHK19037.1 hypothetical protein TRIVIDRAFT_157887 [Trichoderma virens Gv29-8]UKZ56758.1 hypothetical protein TrVGV298_010599 [Trichoderma virens]